MLQRMADNLTEPLYCVEVRAADQQGSQKHEVVQTVADRLAGPLHCAKAGAVELW